MKMALNTFFGLMGLIGTTITTLFLTGFAGADALPKWVVGVAGIMAAVGIQGVAYLSKMWNVTGGNVANPDIPITKAGGGNPPVSLIVLLLLIPMILLSGCLPAYGTDPNGNTVSPSPEIKFMGLMKVGNATINGLAVMKKVGVFSHEENVQISIVVDAYVDYVKTCRAAMDKGTLTFDMLNALSVLTDKMLDYQLKQGGGVPSPAPIVPGIQ